LRRLCGDRLLRGGIGAVLLGQAIDDARPVAAFGFAIGHRCIAANCHGRRGRLAVGRVLRAAAGAEERHRSNGNY
jgi:hypothetical protein